MDEMNGTPMSVRNSEFHTYSPTDMYASEEVTTPYRTFEENGKTFVLVPEDDIAGKAKARAMHNAGQIVVWAVLVIGVINLVILVGIGWCGWDYAGKTNDKIDKTTAWVTNLENEFAIRLSAALPELMDAVFTTAQGTIVCRATQFCESIADTIEDAFGIPVDCTATSALNDNTCPVSFDFDLSRIWLFNSTVSASQIASDVFYAPGSPSSSPASFTDMVYRLNGDGYSSSSPSS